MDLDLRLVRYAVVLADELHFGRAADRLGIAQQTLSAQIQRLERVLGVPLFVRDRRHVEVTPPGERFVARGRELMLAGDALVTEIRGFRWGAPPLRVDVVIDGATPSLAVRDFQVRHPDVPVEIHQSMGVDSVARAAAGELDIVFGSPHRSLPRGMTRELMRYERICLMLPATHPLAAREKVTVAEARRHQLLMHGAPGPTDWARWQETFLAELDFPPPLRRRGSGTAAAIDAVVLSGLPRLFTTVIPILDRRIVRRPLVDPVPIYPFYALWRTANASASLAAFLGALRDLIAEQEWLALPEGSYWLPGEDRVTITRPASRAPTPPA